MKMTKTLKKKWIKALTSGEYGQTSDTLCDGNGNYCCLGVLEHVVMKGEVEVRSDGSFRDAPTQEFYNYAGMEASPDEREVIQLIDMNDDCEEDDETGEMVHHSTFKDIALWIDKNIKTF